MANVADAIAYNHHDVDDGIRAGLLTIDQLSEEPLFADCLGAVLDDHAGLQGRRLVYETIRRMIDRVVTDVIDATRDRLAEVRPTSIDDVRRCGSVLVEFSDAMLEQHVSLKRFLMANLYKHEKVKAMTDRARHTVEVLFERYFEAPASMPDEFSRASVDVDEAQRARIVADYIAGMTDRYALKEFERLTA